MTECIGIRVEVKLSGDSKDSRTTPLRTYSAPLCLGKVTWEVTRASFITKNYYTGLL